MAKSLVGWLIVGLTIGLLAKLLVGDYLSALTLGDSTTLARWPADFWREAST